MLDQSMLEQLKGVFAKLEKPVELVVNRSTHADQAELVEMLKQVASTSDLIKFVDSGKTEAVPSFYIAREGKPNGIEFKGIPGGHEFTSLILAILNSDGKGKFPDEVIVERIRRLKGPIHIQTFMSLTCENCPEVVQALNQIAILHGTSAGTPAGSGGFRHEIIDGGYQQDRVKELAIQGVPSLVVDSKLIHSGRIQLIDLIAKLESVFGTVAAEDSGTGATTQKDLGLYDVVVIGGGPAGASAAIYSVRKGLKTAILTEKIGGQVQETRGIENLISVVYTEGPKLSAQLNEHIASYPIKVFENRRVKTVGKDKVITLESGEVISAKQVIVTTGAKWRELGVLGEKEYIGRGVAFCPHCDGPYYKGKRVAVVGGGNSGVEAAIDLAGIVREVVLFEYNDALKADQILVDKLNSLPNVEIVVGARTSQIYGDGQKVSALEYEDRKTGKLVKTDLDGVFVQIGLIPNSGFLNGLVELSKYGEIVIDPKCRTSQPGIYAAGDVTTTPFKQIIIAMGEGAKAALSAFEDSMRDGAVHA